MTAAFRSIPTPGKRDPGRCHPNIDHGRRQAPDLLVLHWSQGAKDLEALAALLRARPKEASYNYAFDRFGAAAELIPPEDAAWHVHGAFPLAGALEDGFVPLADVEPPPPRLMNLRSVAVLFANRGPLNDAKAEDVQRHGGHIVEGPHRNPACQIHRWEEYSDDQLGSFVAMLPAIMQASPTLRYVVGHEDVTNSWIEGRGRFRGRSHLDPGPAFPWSAIPWPRFGLTVARYDYSRHGWTAR